MKLKVIRAIANITQIELSEKSGLCQTTISFIETAKIKANTNHRQSIIKALNEVLGYDISDSIEF